MQTLSPLDSTYRHTPLTKPHSIRLLSLKPIPDESLTFELIETSLSHLPKYEALSYAWDAQRPECPILCNGKSQFVTANCRAALLRLRQPSERLLWVDSVCIDQTSEEELSSQVPLMGEIYSKASTVIIWLGESTPESALAIKFLKDFFYISQKDFFREFAMNRKWRQLERADAKAQGTNFAPVGILDSLIDRSWFQRMWTVQELALARNQLIMCGADTIDWDELNLGFNTICHKKCLGKPWGPEGDSLYSWLACHQSFESLLRRQRNSRSLSEFQAPSLTTLLWEARRQQTTNPKDVIYGIYALLSVLGITLPTPDYSLSVEHIYTEAAKAAIFQYGNLQILYQVSSDRKFPSLPSWVPSYNEQRLYWPQWKSEDFSCSKDSDPRFTLDGTRLSLHGKFVDKVASCSKNVPSSWDGTDKYFNDHPNGRNAGFVDVFEPLVKAYKEWCCMAARLKSYPTGETFKEALCRTLIHDHAQRSSFSKYHPWGAESCSKGFEIWYAAMTNGPTFDELDFKNTQGTSAPMSNYQSRFDGLSEEEKSNASAITELLMREIIDELRSNEESAHYDHFVRHKLMQSRFFITDLGYMGTGPPNTKDEDLIFLVCGLALPMIVREEHGSHILIGPAYVHGIMDGEKWVANDVELDLITLV